MGYTYIFLANPTVVYFNYYLQSIQQLVLGLHDKVVRPTLCHMTDHLTYPRAYLGPAITSICGQMLADHPRCVLAPIRLPYVALFPIEPVSNSSWAGTVRRMHSHHVRSCSMSDVGFEHTTSYPDFLTSTTAVLPRLCYNRVYGHLE